MASTSSVYGANTEMPFEENQKCDTPISFYSATKKANEGMAHSYSHIFHIPTTMFRFFTVYGPWVRPDMALFKFTKAILQNSAIEVFNQGDMKKDFTYVEDLVEGIRLLIDKAAVMEKRETVSNVNDSLSLVAPWRVVNIGNSNCINLMQYIEALEDSLGIVVKKKFVGMQAGDVPATWADNSLLGQLTGYKPLTDIMTGVFKFVNWYRDYYQIKL
jgi:UDP-glucuronate 4-epimerase